jgi:type IV secretion system protein VirB6
MAFTVFNPIQAAILGPITSAMDVSGELIKWVMPFFVIGVTLYLINYGIEVWRGNSSSNPILEAGVKVAKPFLVLNLALAGGAYSNTVVGAFQELRTSLSGLFGASGGNSYAALDGAVSSVTDTIVKGIPEALDHISVMSGDFSGVVMLVSMGIILLAFVFYCVVAALNLLIIDASLSIVLGVGPLFVACLAFQATSKFFDSWLSAVLKYVLTAVFLAALIGISNGLILKAATRFSSSPDTADSVALAAACLCSCALLVALLFRASAIASDLVGGIALNMTGPAAVAKAMSPVANAAGYVAGSAVGGAGRAMDAASRTPLGLSVLQATMGMREKAAAAANGAKNLGGAITGQGVGNAFNVGRSAASSSKGVGVITGSRRPTPHVTEIG